MFHGSNTVWTPGEFERGMQRLTSVFIIVSKRMPIELIEMLNWEKEVKVALWPLWNPLNICINPNDIVLTMHPGVVYNDM